MENQKNTPHKRTQGNTNVGQRGHELIIKEVRHMYKFNSV